MAATAWKIVVRDYTSTATSDDVFNMGFSVFRGGGSLPTYLHLKGKSLTRTWTTIYFVALIYS